MALTYTQLQSITRDKFLPRLYDQIYDNHWLFARMKEQRGGFMKQDGGLKIMVPLEYAKLTAAGWYTGTQTLDTADNETYTAAYYDWKFGYVNVTIARTDELKNMGDSQVIELTASKIKSAGKTLTDLLATSLYNAGTTTNAPQGLRLIVSTSSTVGGISQSDYSWWAASGIDSSTAVVSISALQTGFGSASKDNEQPSCGVTTQANYNRIYALIQPQQRFADTSKASVGFQTILMNGKPIGVDSYCPANYFFWLNEDYFWFVVHSSENFRMEPWVKPYNQNARSSKIYVAGNFVSSNNRMLYGYSALAA